jgi:2-polyprenyl-6-methoxyphenol hydroxylase-like FAD-dependent oxidoreductase
MTDPILIAGAGPTGLTAALELSRMGVAVRLIDKRDAPATTSRATGVQARTLELFEQRGLADEMVRLGNRAQFGSVYGGGKRVFRFDFSHIESRYPFLLFISQAETERILREAAARQGVTPEWNTELVGIGQGRAFARLLACPGYPQTRGWPPTAGRSTLADQRRGCA